MGAQDQRPRFYEGQYLGAEDLAAIVDYLRAADARHALGAHTWGIALGLYLIERPAPGGANRREIVLTPGVAWDGYGRAIVVTRPTRLSEERCASIPFDPGVDSGATPKGRPVRVWLNYAEIAARQPPPGFESCGDEDQNARVAETFDFVVGSMPEGPARQGNVAIGTETLQAEEALRRFDSAAPLLYDSSVPHQIFPSAKPPARWLVPAGLVRWVARDGELGYYASSEGVPDYRMKDCTRAFRRYIGAVVENLVAADGAIVLQRRGKDPKQHHKLAWLLSCGRKSEELLDDLAWIEGNLRVVGDAKLAGGRLLMRDADGDDEGAPIYLQRTGDDPSLDKKKCCEDPGATDANALARAPREFRAAIGKKGQNAHRFIVGPEVPPDAAKGEKIPSLAPRFVVTSGMAWRGADGSEVQSDAEGRAGVNTRDPAAALEVKGDWNAASKEDGAVRVSGKQPTIRYEGGDDVNNLKWITQLTDDPLGAWRIAYRVPPATPGAKPNWQGIVNVLVGNPRDKAGEKVGIRTAAPGAPLGVRADGDTQDLLSFEDPFAAKKWTVSLKPDNVHLGLGLHEVSGNATRLFVKAGGNVGIGTTDPQNLLHVSKGEHLNAIFERRDTTDHLTVVVGSAGSGLRFSDSNDFFIASQPYAQRNSGGFGSEHLRITPAGKVGIGTSTPRSRLEVAGPNDTWGTAAFVPDPAKGGTSISHVHWGGTGDWYLRSASPSGRVILQDTGGNVGIGTTNPQQKLHVDGDFVRVDGAGNEQAYIGGDGSFAGFDLPDPFPDIGPGRDVQIGSFNSAVGMVHLWNRGSTSWMWLVCQNAFFASDAKHKTDIRPLSGALDRVTRLRGVNFKWKRAAGDERPARSGMGVIAQEVAEVIPEIVGRARGSLVVSYTELVPLLIEAVKELKGEVDELRALVEGKKPRGKKSGADR